MQRNSEFIVDRLTIFDLINRFCMYADWKEWDALRELLANSIWIDYSSFDGSQPERVDTRILISSWRELVGGFEAVQHLVTNHCIDVHSRTRATCRAHLHVHHTLPTRSGGSSWVLGGTYTFGLERLGKGWKISRIVLQTLWSEGNQNLFNLAFVRAQEVAEREPTRGDLEPMTE